MVYALYAGVGCEGFQEHSRPFCVESGNLRNCLFSRITNALNAAEFLDQPIEYSEAALATILSPRHFVEVRQTLGGPAPEETARAAEVSRLNLEADERWRHDAVLALNESQRKLTERSAAL